MKDVHLSVNVGQGLSLIDCLSVVDWIFRCKGCSQKIEADECNLGFKWPMTEESLDTSSERSVSFRYIKL